MTGDPSSKNILIMDDDAIFRKLIKRILEKDGFRVREAKTGRAAWSALNEELPDLVVVDGELPDTDGIFWIGECRKRGYKMAIIFASSLWRERQVHDYLKNELGVALVLHKPIVTSEFGSQVMKVLKLNIEASKPSSFAEKLKELNRQYAISLKDELEQLTSEMRVAREEAFSPNVLNPLIARSHRLRGSSPSFGFTEIGREMGILEDHCRECLASCSEPDWPLLELTVGNAVSLAGASWDENEAPVPVTRDSRRQVAMVIETDPQFLDKMARFGEANNILILNVDSADAAIDIARLNHPNLIVANTEICVNPGGSNLMQKLHNLLGGDNYAVVRIMDDGDLSPSNFMGISLERSLDEAELAPVLLELLEVSRQSREHILIVDDDTHFLELASETLISHGFTTTVTDDPIQLETLLEKHEPDLILLDVELPGVSGFDLCQRLRNTSKWQSIPIFILSVHNDPDTRVTAFHSGADDYIAKPIVGKELVARIEVRLERRRFLGRYQEALCKAEQAEKNLAAIFNKLESGVLIVDHNGDVTLANPLFGDYFQVEPGAVLGRKWESVLSIGDEDLAHVKAMLALPTAQRTAIHLKIASRHLELDVQDDPRNPNGRILYFKDVTELTLLRERASS